MFNRLQHSLPLVDRDQFDKWLKDPVTEHFFKDLENTYLDCMLDPLQTSSMDRVAIVALKRESYRELIDKILEWTPQGVEKGDDEEGYIDVR